MPRFLGVIVSCCFCLFFFACGGSSGDSTGRGGLFGSSNLGSSGMGGPSNFGPGSGNPTNFTPGGNTTPAPTPAVSPTVTPTPSLGLFVRAGASGSGTESDPGGDLGAALAVAQSGDTVTILYSPDPLQFGNNFNAVRLAIPDGVNLVGELGPGGVQTRVQGLFSVGDNVTISNFYHSRFVPTTNFDLTGAHNVTFSEMTILGNLNLNEVSGRIEFLNCDLTGGYSYVGQVSSGQADIVVDDCRIENVFNLTSNGTGTVLNFDYLGSTANERNYLYYRTGASGNVRVEDNTLSYPSSTSVQHHDGSSGNVSFTGNTIVTSGGTGGGGLSFRSYDAGGGGTILARNNTATNCNGRILDTVIDHGTYDILALSNSSTYTGSGPDEDIRMWASNNARVRLRAENNTLNRSLNILLQNNANVDAGISDNRVGASTTQFSGVIAQAMPAGFAGRLNAIIRGNTIGTPTASGQITIRTGSGDVQIDQVLALGTANTIIGSGGFIDTSQSTSNPATEATTAPNLPPIP